MLNELEAERVNMGVGVNSWPIPFGQNETCNSLKERAFVAENGPEAAGFVDQIVGAVGAVRAGGCVRKKVKLI